ncbi:MAG: hypothetical protein Fur0040_02840 [Sideroxydans sp.]
MNDPSHTDDLPVLTDIVHDDAPLPVLTEVIEEPPAAAPSGTGTSPVASTSDESALAAQLESFLAEKLAARLASAQQAALAEALAELRAELPELIRRAQSRPRS